MIKYKEKEIHFSMYNYFHSSRVFCMRKVMRSRFCVQGPYSRNV